MGISMVRGSVGVKSPLERNSRIFIPKSERFENPAKRRESNQIGLSHASIDLKDLPSTNKYRTASFGYGYQHGPV